MRPMWEDMFNIVKHQQIKIILKLAKTQKWTLNKILQTNLKKYLKMSP